MTESCLQFRTTPHALQVLRDGRWINLERGESIEVLGNGDGGRSWYVYRSDKDSRYNLSVYVEAKRGRKKFGVPYKRVFGVILPSERQQQFVVGPGINPKKDQAQRGSFPKPEKRSRNFGQFFRRKERHEVKVRLAAAFGRF